MDTIRSSCDSVIEKDESLLPHDSTEAHALLSSHHNCHKQSTTFSYTTQRQHYSFIRRHVLTLANVVFVIFGISVWAYVTLLLRDFRCDGSTTRDEFEPDLAFSSRVTFQPHRFYGGPPTNATNEMWRRLSPPGSGIVSLPRKYTKNLHPSLPDPHNPSSDVYGISMFHQLHCLNFLRLAYFPEAVSDMPEEEVNLHRDHCLDYIRQAIMCNGDVTFEPTNHIGVDGMGATHQCRDFDVLFSWAYEHRSNRKNGSGYVPERHLTPEKENKFDE